MCGIFGYIGEKKNLLSLLKSLSVLEYRGYDSCGICYYDRDFLIEKSVGNVSKLKQKVSDGNYTLAIAHTRWATHGLVNEINAHPHSYGNYIIVHNGVIDNYQELMLKCNDEKFISETDTEIVAHLLNEYSIEELFSILKGNFAILIINKLEPNRIYFMKNNCPLLICKEDKNIYFSSDLLAFPSQGKALSLCDGSYGFASSEELVVKNIYNLDNNCYFNVSQNDINERDKEHLLYEIMEQPNIINELLNKYRLIEDSIKNKLKNANKIYFIGCGSSYYASLYLSLFYTKYYKKEAYALIGSEFDNDLVSYDDNTLFVYLSQSGETADLIDCYKQNKCKNAILLTNVVTSTLARKINDVCYLYAYPELSVASTKAFIAMIVVGIMIGKDSFNCDIDLSNLVNTISDVIASYLEIEKIAKDILLSKHIFIIGSKLIYPLALESSLKIREVTYLSSWGMASAEFKHGTISMVDFNTVAIGFDDLCLKELASRGCRIIKPNINISGVGCELGLVIYCQLLAYFLGKALNLNVDQPKNLAKSVTVK